jgi:tRNA (mo5U34)-methyltransferase
VCESGDELRRVADHDWWHTIEVAPGVVTPGGWDLRPTAARIPWPASLEGLRCLDVGTMDGYWAFELERRGAQEVLATDLADSAQQDSPYRRRGSPDRPTSPDRLRGAAFRTAAELLGSRVVYQDLNVYDLNPGDIGQFDLVFLGYLLQLVRDPLRALEAVRSVCRRWVIVLDTVSAPLSLLPAPLARLSARRGYTEWFVFNRAGLARALVLTGFDVEAITPILRDHAGPGADSLPLSRRVRHALGVLGRSVAIRGRSTNLSTWGNARKSAWDLASAWRRDERGSDCPRQRCAPVCGDVR